MGITVWRIQGTGGRWGCVSGRTRMDDDTKCQRQLVRCRRKLSVKVSGLRIRFRFRFRPTRLRLLFSSCRGMRRAEAQAHFVIASVSHQGGWQCGCKGCSFFCVYMWSVCMWPGARFQLFIVTHSQRCGFTRRHRPISQLAIDLLCQLFLMLEAPE
jgi:hypothetical protein